MLPRYEKTIKRPVSLNGVGLHHGVRASIRICPASAGTGIVFQRTDLDNFEIPATWEHVARVSYATSLMREGVLLSTTEHLLSMFSAMGVDNARVEIDNLEVPIADGSSKPFVDLLAEAGLEEQSRERSYLKIAVPIEVVEGVKRVSITPAESFSVRCLTDFGHSLAGVQQMQLEITPGRYSTEIAPARTFGFERDLEQLRDMGLIRGATLENAICFGEDEVLNPGGLRFPDECCRHKVLDLIGDLALLGRPVVGAVVAEHAGHAMHAALVKRIMSDPSCYELVSVEELTSEPLATATA